MSKPRTGAPKRVAVGLLAGALAMFGVALAPPAGATATVTNERLAGTTRYGTAQAISAAAPFATPTTAIVATGANFPDALAASTLAGANAAAPIVLTEPTAYSAEAKAALGALKGKGVTAVTIVGGTSAVSAEVETAIKGDGFTVARVAGDDRYETAAAIAQAAEAKSAAPTVGGLKTAFIATGTNYPDALAAGPGAYANKLPLLLVNDTVPTETSNAIATLGIKKVIILGGTSAVSTEVEGKLVAATGNPATRLAGTNRFGTASAVGDYEIATLAFPATSAVLATGVNFPDALAAGPLGGALKAPIVLTASLPAESQAFLDKYSSKITKLYVSGGTASIDDATVTAATTAAQNIANDNPSNTTVTSLPELVSASITKTVTPAQEVVGIVDQGTYVTYTFDEAAFGATAGNFKVYNQDGTSVTAAQATVQTTPTQVVARFASINTATLAGNLTVATVTRGAVVDSQGNQNPEGDTGIGVPSSNTTGQAGVTAAPDLTAVGGFRANTTGTGTIVDLTFDQAATVVAPAGFHLVRVSGGVGTDVTCTGSAVAALPSGGGLPGGSGTTTLSVSCPNDSGATPLAATSFQRAYVDAGAVASSTAVANVMEAQDIGTSSSVLPDLISVAFTQGTTSSPNDTAVFTFDQPVSAATAGSLCVYTATPTAVCTGSATSINSVNPAQVQVTYGPTTLDNAVGAQALLGAVTASSGSGVNHPDEVGVSNTFATNVTPGTTAGPDLTTVTLAKVTDNFGNQLTYKATYTFDTAATSQLVLVDQTRFRLYTAAGLELDSTNCTVGSAAASTGNTVTCGSLGVNGYGTNTDANTGASVLGTVLSAAVSLSSVNNPEGGNPTTGGTGTAVNP